MTLFLSNERGDRVIRAFRGFTSTSLPAADTEHYEQRDRMTDDASSGDDDDDDKDSKLPQPLLTRRTSKLVQHRVIEGRRSPHQSPRLRLVTRDTGAYVERDDASSSSSVDLTDEEEEYSGSHSNSTERLVRAKLERDDTKLVVVNNCALLYASDSVVVGNNNNVFGDNNFILGNSNCGYGNLLRAHGADNNLQGEHCTNFDTSRGGHVSGNLSVRIRVIPQSLLVQIAKSGEAMRIVRRLSLSDKIPLRTASTPILAANGGTAQLNHSAAAAVQEYTSAASESPAPKRRQKRRLRKKKNM